MITKRYWAGIIIFIATGPCWTQYESEDSSGRPLFRRTHLFLDIGPTFSDWSHVAPRASMGVSVELLQKPKYSFDLRIMARTQLQTRVLNAPCNTYSMTIGPGVVFGTSHQFEFHPFIGVGFTQFKVRTDFDLTDLGIQAGYRYSFPSGWTLRAGAELNLQPGLNLGFGYTFLAKQPYTPKPPRQFKEQNPSQMELDNLIEAGKMDTAKTHSHFGIAFNTAFTFGGEFRLDVGFRVSDKLVVGPGMNTTIHGDFMFLDVSGFMTFSVFSNFLIGRTNHKADFFIGPGLLFTYGQQNLLRLDPSIPVIPCIGGGYRYIAPRRPFVFRAGLSTTSGLYLGLGFQLH